MKAIVYFITSKLPKKYLSFVFGKLASTRFPAGIQQFILRTYSKMFKIDLSEAEFDLSNYKTLNEFFTRHLKPGARTVGNGWVHPCDGFLKSWGLLTDVSKVEAKGIFYPLKDFLHEANSDELQSVERGYGFLNYYLHPKNYHRVHAPWGGRVVEVRHVPGELWPVNNWAAKAIPGLFRVNERVVYKIASEQGTYYLVMVGAFNVGQISVTFDQGIRTNVGSWKSVLKKKYAIPHLVQKGQEIGCFHMGSTVVIFAPKALLKFPNIKENTPVKVGDSLENEAQNSIHLRQPEL